MAVVPAVDDPTGIVHQVGRLMVLRGEQRVAGEGGGRVRDEAHALGRGSGRPGLGRS